MEGMDPNHPPPKETRIPIRRWEYTDPVGVPHPDVVDLVVLIRNDSPREMEGVSPDIQIQWLEGSMRRKESAAWDKLVLIPTPAPVRLAVNETRTFRFPIDLAAKMKSLAPKHAWPWALRVIATAKVPGTAAGSTQAELPIIPGD
jgi:hypothetical protein